MEKYCNACKISKPIVEFSKNQSRCKNCKNGYYHENKQKWREWEAANAKKRKEYNTNWNALNQEKIALYNSQYNSQNKIKKDNLWESWYRGNSTYYKDRYNNDLNFRMKAILRARINQALKGKLKSSSSIDLLGCTIEEYKEYISQLFDKNMNWDNYGTYWEIDHIKPCDSFDLSNLEEQKKCFHYTNTQPLEKINNRIKSNKHEK